MLKELIMIKQFTEEEFNNAKSKTKLSLKCEYCFKTFQREKKCIKYALNNPMKSPNFCSNKCKCNANITKQLVKCANCETEFLKRLSNIRSNKNDFCSLSCSASYNNKHKTSGNRRSKLEKYIEEHLTILLPNIEICYNKKDAIGSELDIYIPSLQLAFELNGIFHYEPIFGNKKLNQIVNGDVSKYNECIKHNIDLCIIDTSQQKYFKESTSIQYFTIISNIIKERLLVS